jgi:hypothetical protein
VLVVVRWWAEERSRGMIVDKWEDYNKGFFHMQVDIEGFHTLVVVGDVNCGVYWYQSIHPLSETSQVCPSQMAWVLGRQVVLYTSTLTVSK